MLLQNKTPFQFRRLKGVVFHVQNLKRMQNYAEDSVYPNGIAPEKVEQMVQTFKSLYNIGEIREMLAQMLITYLMFHIITDQLLNKQHADSFHANYTVLDKLLLDIQNLPTPCKI